MSYLGCFFRPAEDPPFAAGYCTVRFSALAAPLFFAAPAVPAVVPALRAGVFRTADAPLFLAVAGPAGFAAGLFAGAAGCGFAPVPAVVPP
jgi:hypothetical protein